MCTHLHLVSSLVAGLIGSVFFIESTVAWGATDGKVELQVLRPVVPVLIGKADNPLLALQLTTSPPGPNEAPAVVTEVTLELAQPGTIGDLHRLRWCLGDASGPDPARMFGGPVDPAERLCVTGEWPLEPGPQWLWLVAEPRATANIDHRIEATVMHVRLADGRQLQPGPDEATVRQRIGIALRQRGDDGIGDYRIPGLTSTNEGTLIAVYDIRRQGGRDLPGDIDVGMSRSPDGGRTWEPMRIIMDMGDDPAWAFEGVGDPAVLVDTASNRIWVAGLWSHGNRGWHGSGPGLTPAETGQLLLVHSDDDGLTWSDPINITSQIKRPEWHLLLQGPGRGITLRDGTLVFAAQYQAAEGRVPQATLIYSLDGGQSWSIGSGVKSKTTEAQLVQLGDGSIMLNSRDDRGGARTVAVTRDLGATWELHPTDRRDLNEPICMGSLLRIEHPHHGPLLLFSNPNTPRSDAPAGRYDMTIKVSFDEGMSWPAAHHHLYDSRSGAGYSCLTDIDLEHIGVLYEGDNELYFLRFTVDELVTSR